jgi:hypothetical protein
MPASVLALQPAPGAGRAPIAAQDKFTRGLLTSVSAGRCIAYFFLPERRWLHSSDRLGEFGRQYVSMGG